MAAASKTIRNLVTGSGTITTTDGSNLLTFSAAQEFKPGATIVVADWMPLTIYDGSGTTWVAQQKAIGSYSGVAFKTSDKGTGKTRGTGFMVFEAMMNFYLSLVDDAGNSDYYIYGDTLYPMGDLHPYTYDPFIGSALVTRSTGQPSIKPVDRVRLIEGALRGAAGSTFGNPDARLDNIESRLAPAVYAGCVQTSVNSATRYAPASGVATPQSSDAIGFRSLTTRAGTVKNLRAACTTAPGTGKSYTITVRLNGVDTALTCSMSTLNYGSDHANSFAAAVGDELSIKMVPAGTPAAVSIEWSFELVAADAGDGGPVDTLLSRGDF